MGAYILALMAVCLYAKSTDSYGGFVIGNRNLGYVPIVGSLAASFRDGSGIVIWIGFGLSVGYGGMWLMMGVLLGLFVYAFFGPRVRQRSLEIDGITVGELIRCSVGLRTEKISAGIVLIFSLMVVAIQLHISGGLLAEIINLEHWIGVCGVAVIVGIYLVLGGYGMVVKTDVIQFLLILSLVAIPFLVVVPETELLRVSSLHTLPVIDRIALFLIGLFFILSSADVWQKVFAARNDRVIQVAFPVSGLFLIIMSLSLIWLGMASKGLLVGPIEDGDVLFHIFDQQIFPAWFLAFVAVAVIAITMSTLDTFCYLFASSLAKNFAPRRIVEARSGYVRFSKFVMLLVLLVASILALTISDTIEFVFSAVSMLMILAPLYTIVGFGWTRHSVRVDIGMSLAIVVAAGVYLSMFVQGQFGSLIMLTVPVFVSTVLCSISLLMVPSQRDLVK
jgi:SSS family solute:Na+ symporter